MNSVNNVETTNTRADYDMTNKFPQLSIDIERLKCVIDYEISLDADKRDYHLLENSIDEYLRLSGVDVEELEIAAERHMVKLLDRIREVHVSEHK